MAKRELRHLADLVHRGHLVATESVGSTEGAYRGWVELVRLELGHIDGQGVLATQWLGLESPIEGKRQEILRIIHKRNAWLAATFTKLASNSGARAEGATVGKAEPLPAPGDRRKVFVVHGRNLALRDAVFQFLRSVGLTPLEWVSVVSATGKTSPYVGEILDSAFSAAQAVVVLLGPEDEARLMESLVQANDPPHEKLLTPQARPNVLFEAGMAMGRYPGRTVLVEVGDLRPFSDIAGMHTIKLNNSSQRRQEFASRLQTAGCPVDLSGTDWHTAGDFTAHSPGNR